MLLNLHVTQEYEALKMQLLEENFQGKVAIIDVGWVGNMQKLLNKSAKEMGFGVDITGFYVGVEIDSPNFSEQKMEGYIFQPHKNEHLWDKVRLCSNILELFFLAPHGSAKKYEINNKNNLDIILYDSEYNNSETYKEFRKIQICALSFAKTVFNIREYIKTNDDCFFYPLIENFSKPSFKLAKYISELKFWEKKWDNMVTLHNRFLYILKSASNLNGNLNCSKELEHYAS